MVSLNRILSQLIASKALQDTPRRDKLDKFCAVRNRPHRVVHAPPVEPQDNVDQLKAGNTGRRNKLNVAPICVRQLDIGHQRKRVPLARKVSRRFPASRDRIAGTAKPSTFPLCNRLKWRSERHLMSRGSRVSTMLEGLRTRPPDPRRPGEDTQIPRDYRANGGGI